MSANARATANADHPPRGLAPPRATGPGPTRGLAIDPAPLDASRRRHPSSQLVVPVEPARCEDCGFASPMRREMSAALRAVPPAWHVALQTRPELAERAAVVRDELHAIANRVVRLVTAPGVRLSMVRINAPSALARAASAAQLAELLDQSAVRLADLTDSLQPDQWSLAGHMGDANVTVADLIASPLHHSHAALRAGDAATTRCA
jgi:hypothetical protein